MFFAVLTLCGCLGTRTLVRYEPKTYTPDVLDSRERAATLANKRYARDTNGELGFNLRSVDGVSVMTMVARDQLVYLNPGRHIIEIECAGPRGDGWRKVAFEALPGRKYEADGRISGDRVEMWIQLVNSNQVVSDVAVFSLPQLSWPIFSGV
jgi:hypothetical protein